MSAPPPAPTSPEVAPPPETPIPAPGMLNRVRNSVKGFFGMAGGRRSRRGRRAVTRKSKLRRNRKSRKSRR